MEDKIEVEIGNPNILRSVNDRTSHVLQEQIENEDRVEEIKIISCHSNLGHFR